ncbi:hypothetical protein QQ045_004201 [Rhodiola kirilowii]
MMADLREHERRKAKVKDKTDLMDDEIEEVDETPCEEGVNKGRQEDLVEDSTVPETQERMLNGKNTSAGRPVVREGSGEGFERFLSKSALKRARQKEKKNTGGSDSKGSKDEAEQSYNSKAKEDLVTQREKKSMERRQKKEKGRRQHSHLFSMISLASWNIKGLNSPIKMFKVRDWILKNSIDCVALLEIKLPDCKWVEAVEKCRPNDAWRGEFSICYNGWARILLLWNIDVLTISVTKRFSHFMCCNVQTMSCSFGLSVVYASKDIGERAPMWQDMNREVNYYSGSWICLGDFNSILQSKEKMNGLKLETETFKIFETSWIRMGW